MKKIFLILTAAILLSSAGCRSSNTETVMSQVSSEHGSSVSSIQEYENSTHTGPIDKTPHSTGKADETFSPSGNTVSTDETQDNDENTESDPNCSLSSEIVSSDKSQEKISGITETNSVSENYFEKDYYDKIWIANRIFELLNEERKAAGVHTREMLTGLNRIAGLRSEQLVTQFSHMYKDENGRSWIGADFAATKYKYGEYFDWNEAGCPELADQNYYTYSGAENCCGGGGCTNEEIAQSIINSFKKSPGHWASLMSEDLYYDGIGVTFGVNPEYPEVECWCSVNSSAENYG